MLYPKLPFLHFSLPVVVFGISVGGIAIGQKEQIHRYRIAMLLTGLEYFDSLHGTVLTEFNIGKSETASFFVLHVCIACLYCMDVKSGVCSREGSLP